MALRPTVLLLFSFILSLSISPILSAQPERSLDFKYEELGVFFSAPRGWYSAELIPAEKQKALTTGMLGVFTPKPFTVGHLPSLPVITVASTLSDARRNSFEVAALEAKKKAGAGFRIIKEPKAVIINGREAAFFAYEKTFSDYEGSTKTYEKVRQFAYFFTKDKYVFQLNFADSPEGFERNIKAFDFCVGTFTAKQ